MGQTGRIVSEQKSAMIKSTQPSSLTLVSPVVVDFNLQNRLRDVPIFLPHRCTSEANPRALKKVR